jgi:hypothetical protein
MTFEVVGVEMYICPTCGQENGENLKYCVNCGTYLINAKKKTAQKRSANRFGVIIAVLAIIGAAWYFGAGGTINGVFANKVTFGSVDVGPYSFSQLVITNGTKTSIPVDMTVREASFDPIEVSAVFYTENGQRIARASTVIVNQMPAGYTTTLSLKLDEPTNLMAARNVRMEVRQLSPFELLSKLQ